MAKVIVVGIGALERRIDEGQLPQVVFEHESRGKRYLYGGVVVSADESAGEFTIKRRSHTTGEITWRGPLKGENVVSPIYMVGLADSENDVDFDTGIVQ